MKRPRSACCSVLRNPRVSSLPVLGQGVTTYIPSATDRIGDLKEQGYWKNKQNQWKFLEEVGHSLGVRQLSDWYSVTRKEVLKQGGGPLLRYYSSLENALQSIYPDYSWESSRFTSTRGPYFNWNSALNSLESAAQGLGISECEDWYSVTLEDLKQMGFPSSISRKKLSELLEIKYPEYRWDTARLLRGRYARQRHLEKIIAALLPDTEMIVNARREVGLINPESMQYLEIDIYLPSLQLGFEYQEEHHYTSLSYASRSVEEDVRRDLMKLELARMKGITLITVPAWWDGTKESLIATVKAERPDLFQDLVVEDTVVPIPNQMPADFLRSHVDHVEDIGQPINATFFTNTSIDPTNWWMFEKYDGIRGFWNPNKKAFYSRKGNQFIIPSHITAAMPQDIFLDGEIWFGRGAFQDALQIAKRADLSNIDWSKFKFMVFDIPNDITHTYSERYTRLEESVRDNPYVQVAPRTVCRDTAHLEEFFQSIMDGGGEGIILRDPAAPYQPGRCPGYLKHKKYRDAEAKVIAKIEPNQWECQLPDGTRFSATGSKSFIETYNPMEEDIVSFKHHGFLMASRKPKFPSLYRVRSDMTWQDVVANWKEGKINATAPPIRKSKPKTRSKGYWRDANNVREYFYHLAERRGFDPLVPSNWNSVTTADIHNSKGSRIVQMYKGSFKKALKAAFPELQFDFAAKHGGANRWEDIPYLRQYLDSLAKEKGINPLDPLAWQSVTPPKTGAYGLLKVYGTFDKALRRAYPEIDYSTWQQAKKNKTAVAGSSSV